MPTDTKGDNFAWVIMGGTDGDARLRGTGSGVGYPTATGVIDLYDGDVHVD